MSHPKKLVLLVDANEVELSLRAFLLETRGFEVRTATTVHGALDLLDGSVAVPRSFDLLVIEYPRPDLGGSGLNAAWLARVADQLRPELPVLMTDRLATRVRSLPHVDVFLPTAEPDTATFLNAVRLMCSRKRGPKPVPEKLRLQRQAEFAVSQAAA